VPKIIDFIGVFRISNKSVVSVIFVNAELKGGTLFRLSFWIFRNREPFSSQLFNKLKKIYGVTAEKLFFFRNKTYEI
jgi:hypothetical protein